MSLNQPSRFTPKRIDTTLANDNPQMYGATLAGSPTPEEQMISTNLQYLLKLDKKLVTSRDLGKARDEYKKLDPIVKQGLIALNSNADYQLEEQSIISKIGHGILHGITSPFRNVIGAGEDYIKSINTPYKAIRQLTDTGKSAKEKLNYVLSRRNFTDVFDGKNSWDEVASKKLDAKHGIAMSTLARGFIDGKKPGEILREYGELDSEMVRAFRDFSDYVWYEGLSKTDKNAKMTPGAQRYLDAKAEAKAYQINPGNDFTNWANSNHPPKEGGIWGAVIPVLLGLPTLGAGAVSQSKDGERWLVQNPNPFSKDTFVSPSGQINAAYSVAIDPLTWLTGGTSKAILAPEKLAETFNNAAVAGKNVDLRIADLFSDPRVAAKHEALANAINVFRDAKIAKDIPKQGYARQNIATYFPEYNEEKLIDDLVNTKVLDDNQNLVPVTNLDTMKKFFEIGENTSYITMGSMQNNMFYRENHVMLERRTRKLTDGMRALYDQIFNGVDTKILNGQKPIPQEVYENLDAFEKYIGQQLDFKLIDPVKDETLKALGISGRNFTKLHSKLFAKQAQNVMLYAEDDSVIKSIGAFRDFARMIVGDKPRANFLAEIYRNKPSDERMNMLASMMKLYSDKLGLASVPKGVELQRAWLEGIFAPTRGFGPVGDIDIPEHMIDDALLNVPAGASQIINTTEGVSMPNFEELSEWLYSAMKDAGLNRKLTNYLGLNGITNNVFSKGILRGWTLGQLFPKLGFKSAVDEATIAGMVEAPKNIYGFFSGKGSAMSNTTAAYSGSAKTMGMVKSQLLSWAGKNPAEYVPAAQRKAMQAPQLVTEPHILPNGRVVQREYLVSADEFFGAPYEERLANMVIAKYAGKLTAEEQKYFSTHLINNSHSLEAQVQSSIGASFGDTLIDGSLAAELYGKSELTLAVEAMGRRDTGKYRVDELNLLTNADRALVQYTSFWKYFGKNAYKTARGNTVDFGSAFIRNNALKTKVDTDTYVSEMMQQIGWSKNADGEWVAIAKDGYSKELIRKSIDKYNRRFRQTTDLIGQGKTAAQITEAYIRNGATELFTIFHGNSQKNNDKLLSYLQEKISEAQGKIAERVGKRSQFPQATDVAKAKKQAAFESEISSGAYHVRKMPFADYEILAKDNLIEGKLKTSYDFPSLVNTAQSAYEKYGAIPWEMMDRQLTDFYRADAFNIKLLDQRKTMAADEAQMVNDLVANGTRREDAILQADIHFDNRATANAANDLLKYADNPNIRTQLAWNARGVGKFYRATEDYARRMARYLVAHPDKVIYRLGHTSQAMSGTGVVYTDDNGTSYVLIPNDGIIWRSIAPAFAAIMNPLRAAEQVVRGNWDFFKQPAWNQSTLKISLLNPSYGEGSGVPSLTGPSMAAPVLGVKAILSISDDPRLKYIGDNLDNWILGPQSDNTTWVRALIPSNLLNVWGQYDPEHKTGVEASTLVQAAAYLQANKATRMLPEDWGNAEKVEQWYDRLRIQAHNVVSVKLGFNTISAAPMGSTEPGIPDELRRSGIVTFRQEFSDILRAVLDVNSKYGYQLSDPIGAAVSMFASNYPDKTVYTVSPNTKSAQLAINYTNETKQWVMKNGPLLETYGDVAFVFAPHVGKYDPSVVKFLEASDLIATKNSPFDLNGQQLKKYLLTISVAKARNDYYNVDRELQKRLTDPNNPERNRASYRQEEIANAKAVKANMLASNPALKKVLGTSAFETRQSLASRFNHLDQLVNNKKYSKYIPETASYILSEQMLPLAKRVVAVLEDVNIRSQFDGEERVQTELTNGLNNLKKYAAGNAILSEAFDSIISPYLNDLYTIPTVAMGK